MSLTNIVACNQLLSKDSLSNPVVTIIYYMHINYVYIYCMLSTFILLICYDIIYTCVYVL